MNIPELMNAKKKIFYDFCIRNAHEKILSSAYFVTVAREVQ